MIFVEAGSCYHPNPEYVEWVPWVPQDRRLFILYGHWLIDRPDHQDWSKDTPKSIEDMAPAAEIALRSDSLVMLDVESWNLTDGVYDQWYPNYESIEKYVTLVDNFRAAAPGVRFGLYGRIPDWDYSGIWAGPYYNRYRAWKDRFESLAPIYEKVDVVMPNIYKFWDENLDPFGARWIAAIAHQADEMRRVFNEKPIYPIIWNYGNYGSNPLLPGDLFVSAAETCLALYDGLMLWSGIWRDKELSEYNDTEWYKWIRRNLLDPPGQAKVNK